MRAVRSPLAATAAPRDTGRRLWLHAVLAVAGSMLAARRAAAADDVVVIVNKDNPSAIDVAFDEYSTPVYDAADEPFDPTDSIESNGVSVLVPGNTEQRVFPIDGGATRRATPVRSGAAATRPTCWASGRSRPCARRPTWPIAIQCRNRSPVLTDWTPRSR